MAASRLRWSARWFYAAFVLVVLLAAGCPPTAPSLPPQPPSALPAPLADASSAVESPPAADDAPQAGYVGLRVATWNIEWLRAEIGEGPNPRQPEDYARLAEYVRRLEADIVFLQEVEGAVAAQRVFVPAHWHLHMVEQPQAQQVGVAWRRDLEPRGVSVTPQADVHALNVSGGLRAGVDIEVRAGQHTLRMLGVHLKSGCFSQTEDASTRERTRDSCEKFSRQIPILEQWLDARVGEGHAVVLAGDFNRRFLEGPDGAPDPHWSQLTTGTPPAVALVRTSEGRQQQCWGSRYPDYIDHLMLDPRAAAWLVPDSHYELVYDAEDAAHQGVLSDHCPVRIELRLPP